MALSTIAANNARIAFQRFGLGPTPGGPASIGDNPKAALIRELNRANSAAINKPTLPSYEKACHDAVFDFELADKNRANELNARIDKHMSAEVGFVATKHEARRRGLGMAVTAAAAHSGFEAGAPMALLQASATGEPLYQRMGFRRIMRCRR